MAWASANRSQSGAQRASWPGRAKEPADGPGHPGPGSPKEIEVVQKIYTRFVTDKQTEREIAEQLDGAGILGEDGRPWTRATVHQVLTNPKYIGANIYNRRSFKLKHKRINNPVDMWIWRDGAFVPIVDVAVFEQARRIIESRHQHLTDQDLLERLRGLLRQAWPAVGSLDR